MAKPDGGPAFPLFFPESKTREGKVTRSRDERPGMSLRDYFAAQVLQGLLASEANALIAKTRRDFARRNDEPYEAVLVREAYALADAMLAERAK